jgi:flagellar basal body-associated protein FliL
VTKHNHKLLFILAYVGVPVLLAWVGHLLAGTGLSFIHGPEIVKASVYNNRPTSNLVFYDLPRVSLSMASGGGGGGTMKLDLSLEVPKGQVGRIADFEPRIVEKIMFFMRRQSYEEFTKPGGARTLRTDLEHEIRDGAFPINIASISVRRMVFE